MVEGMVPKQSVLAIMLAAHRNGLTLRYTRNPDGSEVLEPFTLTSAGPDIPMPAHANQDIIKQFQGRIDRAHQRP